MTITEAVLSDSQLRTLEFLCLTDLSTAEPIAEFCGARDVTLLSLRKLGLIERRVAGGRPALYSLTKLGRDLYCVQKEDGPDIGRPASSLTAGPLHTKEVTRMTATETETTKKNTTKKAKAAPAAKPDLQPLFDELVKAVKTAVGGKTEKKLAYVRVNAKSGKTCAYVSFPTTKSVRVEIPRVGSSGYDVIKATKSEDVPDVVKAAEGYLAAAEAAKAAKEAAVA